MTLTSPITLRAIMKYMRRPKSAALKDIYIDNDVADISGQKYRYRIDIGKGDIDPALVLTTSCSHKKFMMIPRTVQELSL